MPFDRDNFWAFDTETHMVQPGLLAPPLVCGSVASAVEGDERLLSADETRAWFREHIQASRIGGANLPYDLGVMTADDPSLIEAVFKALAEDRLLDTHLLEPLHDNARGYLFRDPLTRVDFKRYSLAMLEERYFGRDRTEEKKNPNAWRLRYAELDGVPLEQWPVEAREYPRKDARGTHDVLTVQLGGSAGLFGPEERYNVHCIGHEMRAAWALHLASMWGFRTDPELVAHVVANIQRTAEQNHRRFFELGLVKIRRCSWKSKDVNGEKVRELEDADLITEADVRGYLAQLAALPLVDGKPRPWVVERTKELTKALEHVLKGVAVRYAEDKGRLKELVVAAYRGNPPLTAGGESGNQQVSTSRDTLSESGNEDLEEYAEAGPNKKLKSTYCDVLELGVRVPINPTANAFVASDRTSYRDPNLQQLPQKGLIRECFIPRSYWPE